MPLWCCSPRQSREEPVSLRYHWTVLQREMRGLLCVRKTSSVLIFVLSENSVRAEIRILTGNQIRVGRHPGDRSLRGSDPDVRVPVCVSRHGPWLTAAPLACSNSAPDGEMAGATDR